MKLWLFDCDGTLYPADAAREEFGRILRSHVASQLGISAGEARAYIDGLMSNHRTASAVSALVLEGRFEYEPLVEATYGRLPLVELGVRRVPLAVRSAIGQAGDVRALFTNSPTSYARRVTKVLGIADLFAGCVGLDWFPRTLKPHPLAFEAAEVLAAEPRDITLVDDSLPNLIVARGRGWKTVWFSPSGETSPEADHSIRSLAELANQEILGA